MVQLRQTFACGPPIQRPYPRPAGAGLSVPLSYSTGPRAAGRSHGPQLANPCAVTEQNLQDPSFQPKSWSHLPASHQYELP